MAYSMDTSGLLDAWVRHYPPDVFPTIWTNMDAAATTGLIYAADEVLTEVGRKDDGLHEWILARRQMVAAIDDEMQQAVSTVLGRFAKLIDTRRNRSGGEPWVVALALSRGLDVVTGERQTGNPDRPNIPDACAGFNIRCIGVLDFFREQGWRV